MPVNRVSGPFTVKVDGQIQSGKGTFTYSGQQSVRSGVSNTQHNVAGFKEEPKIPFIEGAITDQGDLDIDALQGNITIENVSLELANGKTFVLSPAFFAGESDVSTEEGEIPVRWEGEEGNEV